MLASAGLALIGVLAISAPATATTGLAAAPSQLSSAPHDGSLVLAWAAPSDLGGGTLSDYSVQYRVASSNTANSWTTWPHSTPITVTTSATVTGLNNGTAYDWQVAAITGAGTGAYATFAATLDTTPFGAPMPIAPFPTLTGTAIVGGLLSATTGTWNENGRPASYSFSWSKFNGSGPWQTISGVTGSSYVPTVADIGYEILATIRATNIAGNLGKNAGPSATVVAQSGSGLSGPVTFSPPPDTTPGNSQLLIRWGPPATNGGTLSDFLVQYRVSGTLSWTTFAHTPSAQLGRTITGLSNGVAYDVQVAGVTSAGTGAWSLYAASNDTTPYAVAVALTVPSVSGVAQVGQTLSMTDGSWTDNDTSSNVSTARQWQISGNGGTGWTAISGATTASLPLTSAELGQYVRASVTRTNRAGSITQTSLSSTVIAAAPIVPPPVVVTPPVVVPPSVVTSPPVSGPGHPSPDALQTALSVGQPAAGTPISVGGDGLAPNSAWSLELHSTPVVLSQGVASATGTFNGTARLPSSIPAGAHRIILSGTAADGSAWQSTVYFTVASNGTVSYRSTGQAEGDLAKSGTDATASWFAGPALLLLGVMLLTRSHTRRKRLPAS